MNIKNKIEGIYLRIMKSVSRYPITIFSFIMAYVFIVFHINSVDMNFQKVIYTFIMNAFISLVAQSIFEYFYDKFYSRIALYWGSTICTLLYFYFIHKNMDELYEKCLVITIIIFLIAIFSYILIPTIKGKVNINQSFLVFFKSVFLACFYGLVLSIGMLIIINSYEFLIEDLSYKIMQYILSFIFVIFSPLYLLLTFPVYPKNNEEMNDETQKLIESPKIISILISNIFIPLLSAYTIVVILYIIKSISGKFWKDVAFEPMLISYSIIVLIIYILSCNITTKISKLFQKVFPKVLVPIVLLQTIASIIKMNERGLTEGRYYAILFGVFATIAGILFSILPSMKNGIVIAILIGLLILSITPPIDAYTISKQSQIKLLESTLNKNNMVSDNTIIRNSSISTKDKNRIRSSILYLSEMGYYKNLRYTNLEGEYAYHYTFPKIFGFPLYDWREDWQE